MNQFRNEAVIKLGAEEILLRPTFENIASMEQALGSLSYLGYKFSKGLRLSLEAKARGGQVHIDDVVKCMPTLSEIAQIIFYNQAARNADDPTKYKLSLEEIWELVSSEGITCINPVITYISNCASGGKAKEKVEGNEEEKKS